MNLKTQMEKVIIGSYGNTAGIVVRKNGQTVYENYYNGYTASNTIHITSVTKSIVSALIGIAINQGYINSIDDKILTYFPDYKIPKVETSIQRITIKDMITMTAPYKSKTEPYVKAFESEHLVEFALDLLGGKGKIGEFRYSPMVGIHVLSGILTKAIGQSIHDFATENLFSPLEIVVREKVKLHDKAENLSFLKDREISGWVVDADGINMAGWGLTLAPTDMAKIGQLYLDKGIWKGKQIIPTEWVEESTREQSRCKEWKLSYGYLWWIIDGKEGVYAAMGDGGNIIYVNEKKHLIIAIACSYLPNAKDRLKLIKDYIEPVFGTV